MVETLHVKIIVRAPLKKYCWEITFEELHSIERLLMDNYRRKIPAASEGLCGKISFKQLPFLHH
jgi:hypothetical protein